MAVMDPTGKNEIVNIWIFEMAFQLRFDGYKVRIPFQPLSK